MAFSKLNRRLRMYLLFFISLFIHNQIQADLTSLAKNDANPPFSTLSFDDSWLLTKQQLFYRGSVEADAKKDRACFSVSPFAQNADKGKSIKGQPCRTICIQSPPPSPSPDCSSCPDIGTNGVITALGDLTGRPSMLALLFGSFPEGEDSYPGGDTGYLQIAFEQLFGAMDILPGDLNDEKYIDPEQLFGYFSFPLNYRKRGARFELTFRLYNDLIFKLQAGVSSIRQVVEKRIDLTEFAGGAEQPEFEGLSKETVDTYLMDQVDNIAEDMGIDIGDLNQASVEEIRFNVCWRHAFKINEDENAEWSEFLLIPYFEASGSVSPGKQRNPNQLFAVPFGNNGHSSAGFTAGMNFDLFSTLEFGGEVGFTHFFKKDSCDYPVPNSPFQTTIFPFKTDVEIQPGNNWHFGARISSYHFLENLSMYFEWFVVDHKQDKITLKEPDDAFLPEVLEKTTTFKTKMGNLGFNYDVSPNIGIGFLWQIPFSQRNTYRSSTLMAGVNITF